MKHTHSPLILVKEEKGRGNEEEEGRRRFVFGLSFSHVLKRTRVFATDLGHPSSSLILEKRRQGGQVKVTKGHSQVLEVRERQAKVRGRLQKKIEAPMCGSNHCWEVEISDLQ